MLEGSILFRYLTECLTLLGTAIKLQVEMVYILYVYVTIQMKVHRGQLS